MKRNFYDILKANIFSDLPLHLLHTKEILKVT